MIHSGILTCLYLELCKTRYIDSQTHPRITVHIAPNFLRYLMFLLVIPLEQATKALKGMTYRALIFLQTGF
jgi:hypothetical protein